MNDRSNIPATGGACGWRDLDRDARLALDRDLDHKVATEAFLRPETLQSLPGIRKIRALYGLLDRVRAFRLELSTSLNVQLAAEELLLSTQVALTS